MFVDPLNQILGLMSANFEEFSYAFASTSAPSDKSSDLCLDVLEEPRSPELPAFHPALQEKTF